MDKYDARFLGRSEAFKRDVSLVRRRSCFHEVARPNAIEKLDNGPQFDPFLDNYDLQNQEFDSVSAEEWIEIQLLDCQNLARQHGLPQLATILDRALDLLAEEAEDPIAASSETVKAVITPVRVR